MSICQSSYLYQRGVNVLFYYNLAEASLYCLKQVDIKMNSISSGKGRHSKDQHGVQIA